LPMRDERAQHSNITWTGYMKNVRLIVFNKPLSLVEMPPEPEIEVMILVYREFGKSSLEFHCSHGFVDRFFLIESSMNKEQWKLQPFCVAHILANCIGHAVDFVI